MKFIWNGFLFRFVRNGVRITTPYGDLYRMDLFNHSPENPFQIQIIKKRNALEEIEQLSFENEMYSYE